ncbi:MAG: mevalonate kinase [Gammaproteobacteria bacterium]
MNSALFTIRASAPGSLMLAGEHAVLYGYPAIVCAVNQRLTVRLTPRQDDLFTISSPVLGEYQNSLKNISVDPPFQFITSIIQHYIKKISMGFDLKIHSDFSHKIGFGSSAAVTVATIAVFSKWLNLPLSAEEIFHLGYQMIKQVQQVGSGADVAACVFGGVGFYISSPFVYRSLQHFPPLSVVYTGSKEPTPKVVEKVLQFKNQNPDKFNQLFQQIGECTQAMGAAIDQAKWFELGVLFNQHYALQQALGVSNEHIDHLIQQLKLSPQILGAKISGSGLGDCIIGVGEIPENTFPQTAQQQASGVQQIEVQISSQGVRYE